MLFIDGFHSIVKYEKNSEAGSINGFFFTFIIPVSNSHFRMLVCFPSLTTQDIFLQGFIGECSSCAATVFKHEFVSPTPPFFRKRNLRNILKYGRRSSQQHYITCKSTQSRTARAKHAIFSQLVVSDRRLGSTFFPEMYTSAKLIRLPQCTRCILRVNSLAKQALLTYMEKYYYVRIHQLHVGGDTSLRFHRKPSAYTRSTACFELLLLLPITTAR